VREIVAAVSDRRREAAKLGGSRREIERMASAFAIDPTSPPRRRGVQHGKSLFGDDVSGDLRELWRRLVFSLLASSYGDHLRNHGFLMFHPGRWSLSPACDLNPVPKVDRVRMGKTAITEEQEEPTIAVALAAAERFGIKSGESKNILREVLTGVSGRRRIGL
jgi:HipA-like C-terminal domain